MRNDGACVAACSRCTRFVGVHSFQIFFPQKGSVLEGSRHPPYLRGSTRAREDGLHAKRARPATGPPPSPPQPHERGARQQQRPLRSLRREAELTADLVHGMAPVAQVAPSAAADQTRPPARAVHAGAMCRRRTGRRGGLRVGAARLCSHTRLP